MRRTNTSLVWFVFLFVSSIASAAVSDKPVWVEISPMSFERGSPEGEPGRDEDEGPIHTVRITRPFVIQSTEVTQKQWREVMGTSPSYFRACGESCPVEMVNWWEALAYCNALSLREGLQECYTLEGCEKRRPGADMECKEARFVGLDCTGYRLPTEAEWEMAARAGEAPLVKPVAQGDPWDREAIFAPLDEVAFTGNNSHIEYGGAVCYEGGDGGDYATCGPHPVASLRPNAWGIYDMRGNVWEWCWDWHGPYQAGPMTDPQGTEKGSFRVFRGGAWRVEPRNGRVANRSGFAAGYRMHSLGFRPVRTLRRERP